MWIADNWKDYEVLDASGGEKLERWGDYVLVRPDPQVLWDTPRRQAGWQKRNGHYHRSSKGGGEWEFFDLPGEWGISYTLQSLAAGAPHSGSVLRSNSAPHPGSAPHSGSAPHPGSAPHSDSAPHFGQQADSGRQTRRDSNPGSLTFRLKPFSFKHTGLFPEQAVNWEWFSGLIRSARRDTPVRVLNLFAYTGGATLAAAAAGASVTHVDASKGMVGWAKENAQASGLGNAPIRWLVDDCVKFVEREIRRGSRYDGIIMDPPSYGRGPKGEIWKMEENIWSFIGLAAQLLSEDPLFFLINSYTTGLQPAVLSYMMNCELTKTFGGHVEAGEIGLPVTESGLVLPCGAAGRWERR